MNKVAKRNPARARQMIIQAAMEEFSDKGLSGARVNEIARRAGANKRMLYHYFGNKNALYLAAMEHAYEQIRESERTLSLWDSEPTEGMKTLVKFTWHHFLLNPHFIRLLNNENLHKARHIRASKRIPEMHSPLVDMIRDLLDRGVTSGAFRAGIDPIQLYITIAGVCYFYQSNVYTLSTIFGRDLSQQKELDAREVHVVDVIVKYLSP